MQIACLAATEQPAKPECFLQVYLDIVTLFLLLLAFISLTEGGGAAAAPASALAE